MRRFVPVLAWALLGLLAVAAIGISLGKRESAAQPRIESYGPSGLAAFTDLLRREGYQVSESVSSYPSLRRDDVVVACVAESHVQPFGDKATGVFRRIGGFLQSGGRAIILPFNPDFESGTRDAMRQSVKKVVSPTSAQVKIRSAETLADRLSFLFPNDAVTATLWKQTTNDAAVSWLTRDKSGVALTIADGYVATNRFIDQEQNADVLMDSVATIAPKGARLVFTPATYEGEEATLLDILGPAASAAWYQAIFLFIVVVFTLGKRFGLPDETRPPQTGQRQLVDAIADTYRRAGATQVACRASYDRNDRLVRQALKLSSDAPASERDARVPEALALEFRRVFEGSISALGVSESYQRCRALRRQAETFLRRKA